MDSNRKGRRADLEPLIRQLAEMPTYQERIDVIAEDIRTETMEYRELALNDSFELLELLTDADFEEVPRTAWIRKSPWRIVKSGYCEMPEEILLCLRGHVTEERMRTLRKCYDYCSAEPESQYAALFSSLTHAECAELTRFYDMQRVNHADERDRVVFDTCLLTLNSTMGIPIQFELSYERFEYLGRLYTPYEISPETFRRRHNLGNPSGLLDDWSNLSMQ